jgi:hypothetical protein
MTAEPIPRVESVDDAMKRADEAIAALKRQKAYVGRRCPRSLLRASHLQQVLLEASRKVVSANATKRISNGSNGAKPAAKGSSDTEALIKLMAQQFAKCEKRLERVEAHIAELESRPLLEDGGTWQEQKLFRPNQVETYRGAMWVCREPNQNTRPGTNSSWRLLHKTIGGGR